MRGMHVYHFQFFISKKIKLKMVVYACLLHDFISKMP